MRYIGNKTKLLPEIEKLLKDKNILDENLIFCDGFSGTGSVGTYFGKYYKKIISNDTMYFSYIYTNGRMKFNSNFEKLGFDPFEYLNNYDTTNYINGFCYNNYSPKGNRMYFSDENAKKIDFIRDNIENWYSKNKINKQEKYYLIACLIESMSLRSNTYGIFAGYSKKWDERAKKELILNRIETNNYNSDIYNENIIDLMEYVNGDILYLDPPYTARDYSTNYHVLETIAKNDKPELKGITGQRKNNVNKNQDNYSFTKKNEAEIALENVIRKANFKYIILSYSQDGLISKEFIESLFKRYTKKDTYEFRKIKYTKYQDYKSEIKNNHFEYLFFIEKKENIYYDVPLSYQGNKFSIIEWLSEYFPKILIHFMICLVEEVQLQLMLMLIK